MGQPRLTQRRGDRHYRIQLVKAGDFESVLSFGVGLAKAEPFRMYTLTNPSRVVIDVQAPYRTMAVRDYFLNTHRLATGKAPYTEAVNRPVIPPATAFGALQRLFAGPTQAELARGLKFVSSGVTGFKILSIRGGVARVQLTGTLSSGGSNLRGPAQPLSFAGAPLSLPSRIRIIPITGLLDSAGLCGTGTARAWRP